MSNLVRFIGITLVLAVATLLTLAVGGALSSEELWDNLVKILQLAGILLVGSALIMLISKK
jgi:hypothetical protein